MEATDSLAEQFEEHRPRLRSVAYRMLGSTAEADDALQDAWLRASRARTDDVENLAGWFTTVVTRVCLNVLRSRGRRAEQPFGVHIPDPVIGAENESDPEREALLADSVGLALMVIFETLAPVERVAFVLHDMFGLPFDDIATMIDRSPVATRKVASRARRLVQDQAPTPDVDLAQQREVVDAFFAAARDGDLAALAAVLDPDIVLRADGGAAPNRPTLVLRGADDVAAQAVIATRFARYVRPALVNGTAGAVAVVADAVFSVMGFTVVDGKIVSMDVLYDPERLADFDLTVLDG